MVRKRGTSMWMNPGGKPEHGESAAECGVREVEEELGLELDASRLLSWGTHVTTAANEPDHVLVADVFEWPEPVLGAVVPAAEIAEVRWIHLTEVNDELLAPLFVDVIAPRLVAAADS